MKHHKLIQLVLLGGLFVVVLVGVSYIVTRNTVIGPNTEAFFNNYSIQTDVLNVAEYEGNDNVQYLILTAENSQSGIYKLDGTSAYDVQKFLSSNPSFQLSASGQEGQLIPDSADNIRLKESFSGSELNTAPGLAFADDSYEHFYYNQIRCGVPVFGTHINIHVNDDAEVYNMSGALIEGDAQCEKSLSNDELRNIAQAEHRNVVGDIELAVPQEKEYVYSDALMKGAGSGLYLTRFIEVCGAITCTGYFVDTKTGTIHDTVPMTADAINRDACTALIEFYTSGPYRGQIKTLECVGETRKEGDPPVSSALLNKGYDIMGNVHGFYNTNFGHDSFANRGEEINLMIDPSTYLNAFYLFSGNIIAAWSTTTVPDVLMHEFTHGVTHYSSGLVYENEHGSLNESISDVFGSMIDNNWSMGEETGTILRSMSNPPQYGDPDSLFDSRYKCEGRATQSDIVHTNSGVFNKAYYLMVDGGTFPSQNGCQINGVGREKANQVMYKALTTYMRGKARGNYRDMYDAVNQACADVHGASSAECANIKAAMQAVEIDQQQLGNSESAKCRGGSPSPRTCLGGQPPVPTGGDTTVTPSPSQSPSPSEEPSPSVPPTATPTPSPSPTPTPILQTQAQLLSTLSTPSFFTGTVNVTQTASSGELKSNLGFEFLQSLDLADESRSSLVDRIMNTLDRQSNEQSNGQGLLPDDYELELRGRLVGEDVIETGPFVLRGDEILNEFESDVDFTQYQVYEVYWEATDLYDELPILVADLTPETESLDTQVVLDLRLKFQGVNRRPRATEAQIVRIGLGGGDIQDTIYKKTVFKPGENGVWSGKVIYNVSAGNLAGGGSTEHFITVKGPKHSQKKYCTSTPSESGPGLYLCDIENITLANGENYFDFTGVEQPAGDINQDGRVNSVDIQYVRQNIGEIRDDFIYYGDLNNDGIVNAVDDSHIIYILDNRPEQS